MTLQLANILSLARSGATSRAWENFVGAGMDGMIADPKVLTLKGRLLKDQARTAKGETKARLYLQSAKAYADASTLRPDSYPLINAATMSLFAGQPDHMTLLAQRVLSMLDIGSGAGETAYWHEATRAEALLLLGRQADAQKALDRAIVAAPTAWEDRAATLRQFRQILEFRRDPDDWLAPYSPPASVHFKGMIGIAPDDARAAEAARTALNEIDAGFGYGALAAGADILVAEALIERGAELHLVLPFLPAAFRAASVAPYGGAWLPLFDRLFQQAASVTIVGVGEKLSEAAIDFAAAVAKGAAMENAGRLEGRASGLELNDVTSSMFDSADDMLVALERSAQLPFAALAKGDTLITLVSENLGKDAAHWTPVSEGLFRRDLDSTASAHRLLSELRKSKPGSRCALGITAGPSGDEAADAHQARVTRMAQCAMPGTSVTDACSARAMLSSFPTLRIEPLGELPGASGAVEIYALQPQS